MVLIPSRNPTDIPARLKAIETFIFQVNLSSKRILKQLTDVERRGIWDACNVII
jgi:DNA mismatch repair ATPase MutS